ncbi:peptidoglycan/LPS O-acetylase OafA/YrhL [Saccharothrix tamanrassetensis]|uniref:Peptidoglycan/LPS O-acetylase OafA/YrhL n=1 Tax=Saccharothrix tamanrassetensis TaxID=1051531 RepID=A0A841CIR3_9PSEU|nr:acyltransferase [Saccharothrix tamanrassetensis]MBB5956017.1 peptidoglycan/LPS O-acetylase OafA/YrhL [Saccharothrix tamanrassetensis]
MPKPRRINWDVLRVLAVAAVLLQHATHAGPSVHSELGSPVFTVSLEMGASTLVVISAFFACASLAKGEPARFLRNRLARLLPPYAVAATLTYLVLTRLAPEGWSRLEPRDLVVNVLMLQNWFPEARLVDFSYWTLPVQVTGFIAGAVLASRVRGNGLRVLLWTLVVGPLVLRVWTNEPGVVRTFYDGLGIHRAQLFAAGVAIWLWSKGRLGTGHLTALLLAALAAQATHSDDVESTVALGVLLVGIAACAKGPDWDIRPLRVLQRPIRWLAGISYGVYLVHQEIGYVAMAEVARFGPWVELVTFLGLAVVLGWLLTKFVERPAFRALTAGSRPVLVRLLLAARLHAAQSHLGSVGAVPFSSAPLWRPVSQPNTAAAVPPTTSGSPAPVSVQLR